MAGVPGEPAVGDGCIPIGNGGIAITGSGVGGWPGEPGRAGLATAGNGQGGPGRGGHRPGRAQAEAASSSRYDAAVPNPETSPEADIVHVVDNSAELRYEARLADRVVGIAEYELPGPGGPITFVHTEVLPDVEGMGIGSRLARGALDDVRRRGLRMVLECPFITAYVRRHPEYADLIDR
jgi:uncharacterized protein